MKLYYAPGSCAVACWIALEWANAEFSVEKVNPHSEEYKRINPMGKVPALDIGRDRAMTQVEAILQYIIATHPEANLGADEGAENNFEFQEILAFLNGDFHPAFGSFFGPQRFTTATDEESLNAIKNSTAARVDKVMTHLDEMIGENTHVYKNKKTVADAYAFVMARWSELFEKT